MNRLIVALPLIALAGCISTHGYEAPGATIAESQIRQDYWDCSYAAYHAYYEGRPAPILYGLGLPGVAAAAAITATNEPKMAVSDIAPATEACMKAHGYQKPST